jgi:hypothetical protein
MPIATLPIEGDNLDRIARLAAQRGVPVEDVVAYALLLGVKLLESGLDEEEAIRTLQEPGTGLDIPLLMAKRKSRGQFLDKDDLAALRQGSPFEVHWHDDEFYGFGEEADGDE